MTIKQFYQTYSTNQNDFLSHHGILGQKWGVRRFQNKDGSLTSEGRIRYGKRHPLNSNVRKVSKYDGKLYFISTSNMDGQTLQPRVPKNFFTEHGFEDSKIPRVCFAPSIDKCLAALSQNVDGITFIVHEPIKTPNQLWKPNNKAVPDSDITSEFWVTENVPVKAVETITVTGIRGEAGKRFKYGNNYAELYDDWTYEINEKK